MVNIVVDGDDYKNLTDQISLGNWPLGLYFIRGSSERIAQITKQWMEVANSQNQYLRYFLSSGARRFSKSFHSNILQVSSPNQQKDIGPYDVLDNEPGRARLFLNHPNSPYSSFHAIHRELLQIGKHRSKILIFELSSIPSKQNRMFIEYTINSGIQRNATIFFMLHSHYIDTEPEQCTNILNTQSCMLFLLGGQVEELYWRRLVPSNIPEVPFWDLRTVDNHTIVCFRDSHQERIAEQHFKQASQEEKSALAKKILTLLDGTSQFLDLSVASETRNTQILISRYSHQALQEAFSEPSVITHFFNNLRKSETVSESNSEEIRLNAFANFVWSLLLRKPKIAPRLYHILSHIDLRSTPSICNYHLIPIDLLLEIAQTLISLKNPTYFSLAEDCCRKVRRFLEEYVELPDDVKSLKYAMMLNIEALVNYKLANIETAVELEHDALRYLEGVTISNRERRLLKINVLLNYAEVLSTSYGYSDEVEILHETAINLIESLENGMIKSRQLNRIGKTLIRVQRYLDAIRLLEMATDIPHLFDLPEIKTMKFQSRLLLADAYIHIRQYRKATVNYHWILRNNEMISPRVLVGIFDNLLKIHPSVNKVVARRVEQLVNRRIITHAQCLEFRNALTSM